MQLGLLAMLLVFIPNFIYFYRLKDEVMALLERGGHLERIGRDHLFAVRTGPIAAIYPKLDQAQCRDCTLRIFRECKDRLPDGSPRHSTPP